MTEPSTGARAGTAALTLGALGVVFGDIGTSPLYAMQTVFSKDAAREVTVDHTATYGVFSLVFWALVIVVTLKYVVLIMRADNDGEGGIMALIALLERLKAKRSARALALLSALGIFGASLFFGDSMITPAISVLSAVEGLQVVEPSLEHLVVPITAAILIGLFTIQRLGTAVVGRMFGPVMLVWFTCLALIGLNGVVDHPDILKALSPTYGLKFFADDGLTAFLALGGVVLAVTGAEALYADMGHFGRSPIRRAWILVCLPALALNYLGQAALLTHSPEAASSPFFLLTPHWARIPMVLLATFATVIASQSVITGAFSVTRQAVQLGYLPRLRIVHTSQHEVGQVYVPFVNWALMAAVLILVFAFERSEKLASAYGIAVTGTITITTLLFLVVVHSRGRRPLWQIVSAGVAFGIVDLTFLGANLAKLLTGGWLPLVIAAVVFGVLMTWQQGRAIVTRNREAQEGGLQEFIDKLHAMDPPVQRVHGTAVFLNRGVDTTPLALRANVEHNHSLHEDVVILSIETMPVPYVDPDQRLEISELGYTDDGISHVTARFGFQEQPDVPQLLRQAAEMGLEDPLDVDDVSYFLSRIEIVRTDAPGMTAWRKRVFLGTTHLASDAVDYFHLPRDRTVLLGSHVDI